MLIFLLHVCNFLNTGSRFQNAHGFPITQLPQIINFRCTHGKGTLLEYVVRAVELQHKGIHNFARELMPFIELGRDIDIAGIEQELRKLHARLQECASLVRTLEHDKK
uniref:FH2 domain-containing protein n=1 Tax=Lygus hesperus TaxID=30085 RepID=A0A0A9WDN5_LYGHE